MPELNLKPNQAALILESSDDGDISVDIAIPNDGVGDNEMVSTLCKAIAQKLISDEQFQAEIMVGLEGDG